MRKIIFILTLILMICHTAMAEEISNYKLLICKDNQEAANLHVSCSFYLDFQCADSVSMNLGGGQEFSIENLTIKGDAFEYEYNGEAKNIVFHKKTEHSVHVSMEYSYTNLSAFSSMEKGMRNCGRPVSVNTFILMCRIPTWIWTWMWRPLTHFL